MINVLDKVQPKNRIQLEQLIDYAFKHNIYDLNFIDTSEITDMFNLFMNCEYDIDVSNWDVSNVINMGCTFYNCNMFTGKGLENWNVSKVIDMSDMFYYCKKFDCDLSRWNVSNVTNTAGMFYFCKNFDCDLSRWNVSNVENMSYMFNKCYKFEGKGLENWDVSNLKRWENMFDECAKLSCDLSSWQY